MRTLLYPGRKRSSALSDLELPPKLYIVGTHRSCQTLTANKTPECKQINTYDKNDLNSRPKLTLNSTYRHETQCKMIQKLSPDWFHTSTNHLEALYDDYRPFLDTPHVKSSALSSILRLTRFRIAHAHREIWVRRACQKPIERFKVINRPVPALWEQTVIQSPTAHI